uniref:Phosphotransferase family protein n=1 Tax=Desulfomonile tiedjei TaxID=2358 RepID=A0A7C4EWY6_9BACT
MNVRDEATTPRIGESLDAERIEGFLRQTLGNLPGPLSIKQFPSGFSNLTYLVTAGQQEFVLRRPPFGRKARTAHDMLREYRILTALRPAFPYCPKPVVYCDDESVIGAPFYIMERIRGVILRKNLPEGLRLGPHEMRTLCEKVLDVHVELHSLDYRKIGLGDFGKPEGYVARQVESWIERYQAARTPDAPGFEEIIAWLKDRVPQADGEPALIHNDFKLDNIVLDENAPLKIIGVLDWEMATIGEPLMDLGNSLAYWVQADDPPDMELVRLMPTNLPGALTRRELVERYAAISGRSVSNFDFYLCFGYFRLAVIAQQIYYRYFHGQTKDERFRALVHGVRVLEKAATRAMKDGLR